MISSSNKSVVPNLLPRQHFIFLAMIVLSVVWEELDGVDVAVDTIACGTLGMVDRGNFGAANKFPPSKQVMQWEGLPLSSLSGGLIHFWFRF